MNGPFNDHEEVNFKRTAYSKIWLWFTSCPKKRFSFSYIFWFVSQLIQKERIQIHYQSGRNFEDVPSFCKNIYSSWNTDSWWEIVVVQRLQFLVASRNFGPICTVITMKLLNTKKDYIVYSWFFCSIHSKRKPLKILKLIKSIFVEQR